MPFYQVFSILGAIALPCLLMRLARLSRAWRFLVAGPLVYAGLVLAFNYALYFTDMPPIELNRFNGIIGAINVFNWIILVHYKIVKAKRDNDN